MCVQVTCPYPGRQLAGSCVKESWEAVSEFKNK